MPIRRCILSAAGPRTVPGRFRQILDAEPDIEVVAEAAVAGALDTGPDVVLTGSGCRCSIGIEAIDPAAG